MVDIHNVRRSNTEYFPNLPFVAVFVGGTQGIGRYAVEELAKLYSQPILRVYILGRNKTSADEVLASCRRLCPHGKFTFVQARNLALLEDVDATCAEIIRLEQQEDHPRIDLLVQTQANPLWSSAGHARRPGSASVAPLLLPNPIRHPAHAAPRSVNGTKWSASGFHRRRRCREHPPPR